MHIIFCSSSIACNITKMENLEKGDLKYLCREEGIEIESADVPLSPARAFSASEDEEGTKNVESLDLQIIPQRMNAMHDLKQESKDNLHIKVAAKKIGDATKTIEDNNDIENVRKQGYSITMEAHILAIVLISIVSLFS